MSVDLAALAWDSLVLWLHGWRQIHYDMHMGYPPEARCTSESAAADAGTIAAMNHCNNETQKATQCGQGILAGHRNS
jgi:hypothetical protein